MFLGFSQSSTVPRCEKPHGSHVGFLPSHQTETTGYLSRFTNMLEPPRSQKKAAGNNSERRSWAPIPKKKSPWENQKSRRSMIYKWFMFTHFPELCQKMSQILEFNGWLTPLEWSINCTCMWKNLSLQGQPQFSGPMFTVETHAWTYWNGDEKRSICNIQYPKYPQFDTNMWMHPTSTVVRYSTMFNPNIVFLVAYPVRSHYIQWYPAKSLVNLPKK